LGFAKQVCRLPSKDRLKHPAKDPLEHPARVHFDGYLAAWASQLKQGAMVVCDNVRHFPRDFADYLDYVRSYQRCCLDFESQIRSDLC
jgi:hypothetical protein